MGRMISVIIPTYNDAKNLGLCLKSIRGCDYKGEYEIIVFNDGSTDDTEEVAKSYGCKIVNSEKNIGPGMGRNLAAREARGEILAFTDSDCVVYPDWLKLIEEIFQDRKIFAAAGKYSDSLTPQFIAKFRMYESTFYTHQEKTFLNTSSSNNLMCRKEIFYKCGGFGDRYVAEDAVFGYNLYKAGAAILLVPELKVAHHCKTTIIGYLKQQYSWVKNLVDVYINYPGSINLKWPTRRKSLISQLMIQALFAPVIFISFYYPLFLLALLFGLACLFLLNYPFFLYVAKGENNYFSALIKTFYIIILRNYVWMLGAASGVKKIKNIFILFNDLALSRFKKMRKRPRQLFNLLGGYLAGRINYAIFFVTSKCNSRCRMCFYWKNTAEGQNKKELTLEEYRLISSKWKNLFHVSLTGGEPLLRPDLKEIVDAFYKNSSTRSFGITTNGLLPESCEKFARSVLSDYPDASLKLSVSIDAIGEKHDEIRGVKGNFESVRKTIEKMKKLSENNKNLDLRINLTYSNFNKGEIADILDYLKENFALPMSMGLARGDTREANAKNVSSEEYRRAVFHLKEKAGSGKNRLGYFKLLDKVIFSTYDIVYRVMKEKRKIISCVAGRKMAVITEEGEVRPCEMLAEVFPGKKFDFPNLKNCEYDINKALKSEGFKNTIKHIEDTNCYCTFECAIMNSVIYNPAEVLKIIFK